MKQRKLVPNHVIELVDTPKVLAKYLPSNKRFAYPAYLAGRSMVVKKSEASAGGMCGARLPGRFGLGGIPEKRDCFRYPAAEEHAGKPGIAGAVVHPTTKADSGHDMPMTVEEMGC